MSSQRAAMAAERLTELGFTELEAAVYTYLATHRPATAYRIAHAIGKPVANTYKAVESLRQRGALLIDDQAERICRAMPPAELLHALERSFLRRRSAAGRAFEALQPPDAGDGVYGLTSTELIIDRCRAMIAGAREIVLIDVFPAPLHLLMPEIRDAASRGVTIAAQVYAPVSGPVGDMIVAPYAQRSLDRWSGDWMCLVVDGREYVHAYFDAAAAVVYQAVWTQNRFLAWVQHGYLCDTLRGSMLDRLIREKADMAALEAVLAQASSWLGVESGKTPAGTGNAQGR